MAKEEIDFDQHDEEKKNGSVLINRNFDWRRAEGLVPPKFKK